MTFLARMGDLIVALIDTKFIEGDTSEIVDDGRLMYDALRAINKTECKAFDLTKEYILTRYGTGLYDNREVIGTMETEIVYQSETFQIHRKIERFNGLIDTDSKVTYDLVEVVPVEGSESDKMYKYTTISAVDLRKAVETIFGITIK